MRLWGISPTNSIFYSPEPRAEVYCLRLNINISKLGYSNYLDQNKLIHKRQVCYFYFVACILFVRISLQSFGAHRTATRTFFLRQKKKVSNPMKSLTRSRIESSVTIQRSFKIASNASNFILLLVLLGT